MIAGFSASLLLILGVVVFVSGAVNGLAGFGFALVGTMALATVIEPATAVVLMIIPILSANATLVSELSASELSRCGRRFWPLMFAALIGTIVGMAVIDLLPGAPVRVGLGLITLGFVGSQQSTLPVPSLGGDSRINSGSRGVMLVVGGVSGLLFGATNVGVQLIAYLRSFDLSHGLFVSVVAMVFLGINGVRVAAAGALGLYPSAAVVALSVAAVVPSVLGVAVGRRLRRRVDSRNRAIAVLGLLAVIGVRLVLGGLGIA